MFETRGRKSVEAYVDGGLYIVKKPTLHNKTVGVMLPKDWIEIVQALNGDRPIKYFLLDVKDTFLVIKPYFDSIPDIEEGE